LFREITEIFSHFLFHSRGDLIKSLDFLGISTPGLCEILDSVFFNFWTPHFCVSTPHFGWTPRLN